MKEYEVQDATQDVQDIIGDSESDDQNIDQDAIGRGSFFKNSTLIILFILFTAQLINIVFKVKVIPEVISVTVAFICIFYIWLQGRKDIDILQRTNIKLIEAQEALDESHLQTIMSLILSQEAKDSYTYGHSERVKHYSVVIAQQMRLAEDVIKTINRGSKLHDIGKIGIRDEVLFSEGPLTEEQFEMIRSHPIKGITILAPLKFLSKEKLVVRNHHERYDGKGYPDGLKKDEIPLSARIVCIADAFDAMRSSRHYREPLSKDEILAQIKNNSGTQFDPHVVDAFLKNVDHFYV